MAKKPEAKSATETQRRRDAAKKISLARRTGEGRGEGNGGCPQDLGASVPLRQKPSTLLDTRAVYCGDNLEQLAKLPDACDSAFRTRHSAFAMTGSFYYHCDWHASHYVKVMLDQIFGENNFLN